MPEFKDILKEIKNAVTAFNDSIPAAQKAMYQEIASELKRLDTDGDRIKATVANLKKVTSIKNKMLKLILTDKYMANVKDFVGAYNDITKLQHEYWAATEESFKPSPLLREIKNQAIGDTVRDLTEAGIGENIAGSITKILKTNITTGGSYKKLQAELLESLTDTEKSDGLLTKYAKQVTNDSINQFNAQYTHAIGDDLGYEWFAYQGTDIKTTRPFCNAMTDFRYFHISEIPRLLRAEDLYYVDKDGKRTKVPLYPRTGLPQGMIEGTNAANFFIRRGGHRCGHQIRPVSEGRVPADIRNRVIATTAYKRWKSQNAPQ